jgi:hypothetical protein
MTWIVGTSSLYGSAILLSDICVTFQARDGSCSYHDCLQKIYPLGNFVIGGFSGSVLLGFQILGAINGEGIKRYNNKPWEIEVIANTWLPRVARRVYNKAKMSEKTLGCKLIIASAHPSKNRGVMPYAWTDTHIFSAPDFKPISLKAGEVGSIGSGTDVSVYADALLQIQKNDSLQQTALQNPEFQALIIASIIRDVVGKSPQEGVSKYVQIGLVSRGSVRIENIEYRDANGDGTDTITKTPKVVRGYQEFKKYCSGLRETEEKAAC